METGLNAFKEALHLKHVEAGEYSPLALAYICDAVYELAIRTLVTNLTNREKTPWQRGCLFRCVMSRNEILWKKGS